MKLISNNDLRKIKLINKEKNDFNKINKWKENLLIFIIFILLIILFLLVYFFKLKNKDIKDILINFNKYQKYSRKKFKEFKEYKEIINKKYQKKLSEIKNNMNIYTNILKEKNDELKHNLEKANNNNYNLLKQKIKKEIFLKNFLKEINQTFTKKGFANINEIESKFPEGRPWIKGNINDTINVGFQLDPNYILRTMMTLASLIDSQKNNTKISAHFAVVLGFNDENMFKIYSLREKIRDDVEFIFYDAKRVETDFKGMHPKGPGAIAKILLPHLLADDIERILIFDVGDVLILRDLTEMYNWNLSDYLYLGAPDPLINSIGRITKKKLDIYINVGHFLVNVKKVKSENMYEKYLKYKNVYSNRICDQDLLNDIAYGKIGYLPIKYGLFAPFRNDYESDFQPYISQYQKLRMNEFKLLNKSKEFPFLPRNTYEFFKRSSNPVVIHQWNDKWVDGSGLSIYRRLAQYYIRYAGIWEEMCIKLPKYCNK